MSENFRDLALAYHAEPRPGKLSIAASKPVRTLAQLALACSPGVAAPVRAIAADPECAYQYTGKGNLVAVISDGSAILGLGNLGPLASKPVMEGKALLFKRFADINAIDIEVSADSPKAFIDTVVCIADTFGGISLEDIRAPECFEIEQALIERCKVPVFHDDQHGTAIVVAAALLNALALQGKVLPMARVVCLGAGAAATASMRLLVSMGLPRQQLFMVDRVGVIRSDRGDLTRTKSRFINDTGPRTLADAMAGADVCIGLAGPGLVTTALLQTMAPRPVLFACANPDPEIDPDLARQARNDLIIASGRAEHPNQISNLLVFPYIFRAALDVRASCINPEMMLAAVQALSALVREPVPAAVLNACQLNALAYGPDYILPKVMDWRLLDRVSAAVARAAVDSGVAARPYPANYPLWPL